MKDGVAASVDYHGTGVSGVGLASSASYLQNSAGSYAQKYVLINNGPLGLLLNRERTVAMASDTTAAQPYEALIFVQGVTYDVSYTVTLDGTALSAYTTPKATDTNNTISTSTVASQLASKINAVSGFSATVDRYVVWVKRTNSADFTIKIDDSRGNTLARAIKGSVTTLAELPVLAPNGFVINVSSDPSQSIEIGRAHV